MGYEWEVCYDAQNKHYEVTHYITRMQPSGFRTYQETDCFTCSENGEVYKHELYSEVMGEWRACPLPDREKKLYPLVFEKLRERLASEIRKYNEESIDGMDLAKAAKENW